MCVRNYNSDTNNKDVITVDYVITGGRQRGSICVQKKNTQYSSFENETPLNKRIKMELKLHKEGAKSYLVFSFMYFWAIGLSDPIPCVLKNGTGHALLNV